MLRASVPLLAVGRRGKTSGRLPTKLTRANRRIPAPHGANTNAWPYGLPMTRPGDADVGMLQGKKIIKRQWKTWDKWERTPKR